MSVREYAVLYLPSSASGSGQAVVGGGNAVLTAGTHALDGPEHTDASDQTRLDASAAAHGLMPKLSGDASDVWRGDGTQSPETDPVALAALSVHEAAADAHEAAGIGYDHTASGLAATDVQGAVDELAAAVGTPVVLSDLTPLVESGGGAPGTSGEASRADHVHPDGGGGGGGGTVSDDISAAAALYLASLYG